MDLARLPSPWGWEERPVEDGRAFAEPGFDLVRIPRARAARSDQGLGLTCK